jgi:hypothetical protein
VLDEMPYLVREDPGFEGTLQKLFDRTLSKLPVLLVLIGSDLAMMEALNTYGRPFYQRGTEMVVPPLNPAEVAEMLDAGAADAFDAYLVSGGLPLILDEWPRGAGLRDYLERAVTRPTSAMLVVGSVKWLENKPFDTRDHARLIVHRSQLPGADEHTPLIAVARSGCIVKDLTALSPDDLLQAWRYGITLTVTDPRWQPAGVCGRRAHPATARPARRRRPSRSASARSGPRAR